MWYMFCRMRRDSNTKYGSATAGPVFTKPWTDEDGLWFIQRPDGVELDDEGADFQSTEALLARGRSCADVVLAGLELVHAWTFTRTASHANARRTVQASCAARARLGFLNPPYLAGLSSLMRQANPSTTSARENPRMPMSASEIALMASSLRTAAYGRLESARRAGPPVSTSEVEDLLKVWRKTMPEWPACHRPLFTTKSLLMPPEMEHKYRLRATALQGAFYRPHDDNLRLYEDDDPVIDPTADTVLAILAADMNMERVLSAHHDTAGLAMVTQPDFLHRFEVDQDDLGATFLFACTTEEPRYRTPPPTRKGLLQYMLARSTLLSALMADMAGAVARPSETTVHDI